MDSLFFTSFPLTFLNKKLNSFPRLPNVFFCKNSKRSSFFYKNNLDIKVLKKRKFKNGCIKRNKFSREYFLVLLILFLSTFGFLDTIYLTFSKITQSPVSCFAQTCSSVLGSVFSEITGIPLSFFGIIVYFFIFLYALKIYFFGKINFFSRDLKQKCLVNFFIFSLGISGIYFALILEVILKISCQWCILSLLLSSSIIMSKSFFQVNNTKTTMSINLFLLLIVFSFFLFLYLGNVLEMVLTFF